MNDISKPNNQPEAEVGPKVLENSFLGSLMIPVAIVLVGALIIFGVTKMISTDRSYKDLVSEMQSKTFGNRWIAAYELSKQIAASQIPEDEIPWLITNLQEVYSSAKDPRSKEFIVVAMGALRHRNTIPFLAEILKLEDSKMSFHALVAIGNMTPPVLFDWPVVEKVLDSKDQGLQQVAILTLATHRVVTSEMKIEKFLTHDRQALRYSAALGLIYFKNLKAVSVLQEILSLKTAGIKKISEGQLNPNDVLGLKLNILHAVRKEEWPVLTATIKKLADGNDNKKVSLRAVEVLKLLKN